MKIYLNGKSIKLDSSFWYCWVDREATRIEINIEINDQDAQELINFLQKELNDGRNSDSNQT